MNADCSQMKLPQVMDFEDDKITVIPTCEDSAVAQALEFSDCKESYFYIAVSGSDYLIHPTKSFLNDLDLYRASGQTEYNFTLALQLIDETGSYRRGDSAILSLQLDQEEDEVVYEEWLIEQYYEAHSELEGWSQSWSGDGDSDTTNEGSGSFGFTLLDTSHIELDDEDLEYIYDELYGPPFRFREGLPPTLSSLPLTVRFARNLFWPSELVNGYIPGYVYADPEEEFK